MRELRDWLLHEVRRVKAPPGIPLGGNGCQLTDSARQRCLFDAELEMATQCVVM